ncbi:MAG: Fe-S cluster assembly protein SufB, partial [Bacteroidales bacterium]|nr:Fe-S cluster assembly protein SufB [Bacteroidales bacterium]
MEEDIIKSISNEEYKHGFESQIENEEFPRGLNEEIIRMISERKEEPEWLLEFRLKAFRKWQTMTEPDWAHLHYKKPNYQDIIYLSIPKKKEYSEVVKTFDKLGISLDEDKDKFSSVTKNEETMVAVDAVIDSVSVKTMYSKML